MDKRILALGITMLAGGLFSWYYFNTNVPVCNSEMTQEETNTCLQNQALNLSIQNITGLVAGLGFFITLISVGLKRRKKGEAGKSITQKPAQS